jgi:hypothetical protein
MKIIVHCAAGSRSRLSAVRLSKHALTQEANMFSPHRALSIATTFFAIHGAVNAAAITTQSTPIDGKQCVNISHDRETGDTVKQCPGVGGYSLLVLSSDDRASLSIVTNNKATLPLNFWDMVSPTFSTLGPKVEWQVESHEGTKTPVALVVRLNTVDQTDVAVPRPVSFIVVARIQPGEACVIGKVPAQQSNATQMARALATARDTKCLPQIR